MSRKIPISEMDNAIMEELQKYSKLATDDMKDAVKDTAASVRKDIQSGAPVDTGKVQEKLVGKKTSTRIPRVLTLWCIRETGTRLRTCLKTDTPNAAEAV
jgi:hypothetical protein